MLFFVSLLVDGALAGAIYALIALAFVVVYKASRMINFALGEWAMLGSRLVAAGLHAMGLGLAGAIGAACAGMVAVALVFNRLVLRRMGAFPATLIWPRGTPARFSTVPLMWRWFKAQTYIPGSIPG